jgi:predicted metal-dependent hydrolase
MKKGHRIEALARELSSGNDENIYFNGYFLLFNRQDYYQAHDVLEHLWLRTEGPAAGFYKGLIQLAGAFVHLQKQFRRPFHPTDGRRLHPAWRLFKLARKNLSTFAPEYNGLRVDQVLGLCDEQIAALEESNFQKNPWRPEAAPELSYATAAHQ